MMILDLLLSSDGLLPTIEAIDRQALLSVNGSDSLYLDRVAHVLTTAITWLPLYLSLFYVVLKNNDTFRKVLFVLGCAGLCILFAGSVDDLIVKPLVGRWRPTHDPVIGTMVDVVDGYRGGRFGFFSAHAANTFSIAVFFCWLIRCRLLSIALVIWSLTNCWTRLYLGVHFPGDILVGLLWGGTVGTSVYFFYYWICKRFAPPGHRFFTDQNTTTGYSRKDCDLPIFVLVATLLFALLKSSIL